MTDEHKRPFETYETTVAKSEDLSDRVKNITFQLPPGKTLHFKAGQFIQMFIPHEGKIRRTSYSIASSPWHPESFELCVTHVDGGVSSTYLHGLKVGDKIQAMGPLGKFTLPETIARDCVFIATGSGIAPFRAMIHDLFHNNMKRDVRLIFGNRFEGDILYRKDWEALAKEHANFKPLLTLSRPDASWKGVKGYVQDAIQNFVPDPKSRDFYICGLVKMIDAVSEKLQSLGVPKEQIHYERYD